MSTSILQRYVWKDLYFTRSLIVGSLVVALLAIPLLALGPKGRFAAMILMICCGAAPVSFICIYLIVMERKDRSLLFALSLPISPARATLAKIIAATTAYVIPWLLIALGAVALFVTSHAPQGMLPFGVMFWVFLLDQFCLMLIITVTSGSEALSTATLVICNVSISFYFFMFLNTRAIAAHIGSPVAVWDRFVLTTIGIELAIAALLIAGMLWKLSRRRDFV